MFWTSFLQQQTTQQTLTGVSDYKLCKPHRYCTAFLFMLKAMPDCVFCANYTDTAVLSVQVITCVRLCTPCKLLRYCTVFCSCCKLCRTVYSVRTTQILHCFLFILQAVLDCVFCANYTDIVPFSFHVKTTPDCVFCAEYTGIELLSIHVISCVRLCTLCKLHRYCTHCFLFILKAVPDCVFFANYTDIALLSVHVISCVRLCTLCKLLRYCTAFCSC